MFEEYFVMFTMRIKSLILTGYNRFKLRGVKQVSLTVVENNVLIVGTNGCGKSSLLEELSPLPANHQEFSKDGSKVIVVETLEAAYRLTSVFSPQNKHSFIKILPNEEIELNAGGTATIQKQLVKEIFNYDEPLHAVICGKDRFTDMSKEDRQYWIMRLSALDLTYGLSLWNKLKTRHRDTTGSVKYLAKQIAEVSSRKMSEQQLRDLEHECEALHQSVMNLLTMKDNFSGNLSEVQQRKVAIQNELANNTKQFNSVYDKFQQEKQLFSDVNSLDEVKNKIYHLQEIVKQIEYGIEERYKILNENAQLIDTISYFGVENKQQLLSMKLSLENQRDVLWDTFNDSNITFCLHKTIQPTLDVYSLIQEELTDLFMQLDERYTNEQHQSTVKRQETLKNELGSINMRISVLQHQVDHYNAATITECPKCTHKWISGFTEDDIQVVVKKVEELTSRKQQCEDEIELLTLLIEKQIAYFSIVKRLLTIKKNYAKQTLIWETIQPYWEKGDFKQIPAALSQLVTNLHTRAKIYVLDAEISLMESGIRELNDEKANRLKEVKDQWEKIQQEIVVETEKQIQINQTIKGLKNLANHAEVLINRHGKNVEALLLESHLNFQQECHLLMQQFLNQTIRRIQSELGKKEAMLNDAKNIEKTISSLEASRLNAVEESHCLKILMDELSPVNGLLAEELIGFINSFAEQMTTIINSVWTYPMRVIPCGTENGVLDYKFPLDINEGSNKSHDVKKTSMSQLAIVNLAFKLVVMFYLKMDNYPLMLDEVSPNLDEQHRLNITMFIKQFVDSRRCGQMFMVSHDANEAGSFYPHQFCIMDKANIVQMSEYANSQHFKII